MRAITSLAGDNQNIDGRMPVIVVFPHAGGSPRFFSHWIPLLRGYCLWGVTYPGRDGRAGEPAPATLQALAHDCARELDSLLDQQSRTILVGHSMGAWVAYECARYLERIAPRRSLMTVVSGQNPPCCRPGTDLHLAADDELVNDMNRQNPANRALWQHPELRQMFLPVVRDDYRLLETYQASSGQVSDLTVVYGDGDNEIERGRIHDWQTFGSKPCRTKIMSGGHFYLAAPNLDLPRYLTCLLPC